MREFGVVRKDVAGDPEAAAPYIGAARTLLGQLKQRMEAGGLLQLSRSVALPDGTVINVMSRMGQDTIRIFATVPENTPTRPSSSWEPPTPPNPEFENPQLPEPKFDRPTTPHPYMWIGARYRWEDYGAVDSHHTMAYTSLMLVVVEPGNNGVLLADNPCYWARERYADESTSTLDLAGMQAEFSGYYPTSWGAPAGVHNFGLWTYGDNGDETMMFSKNGLRLYSGASCQDLSGDVLTPYDPLASSGAAPRFVPPGIDNNGSESYSDWAPTHKWDQVCVLDPWEAQGVAPFDPRAATAWTRQLLARSGVKTGLDGVLSGNYEILIGAYGEERVGTDRAGQQSPYLPSNQGFRYRYDDFREHLTVPWAQPLRVEIEVRLGKLPNMTTQRFTVEVPTYDSWSRTTNPYGGDDGDGCAFYKGGNPLAMNWYSGAILVNPIAGTAALKPGYVSRIFQPAAYNFDKLRNKRYPIDIYYMTLGNSNPVMAGTMLYKIMDIQCCSYFGYGYDLVQRSAADAQAAATAAGITTFRVYRYDNLSNTMTDVGQYLGVTDFRTMADPLGAASLAICHLPIFCGSDNSISPNYWGWPAGNGACCADTYFGN